MVSQRGQLSAESGLPPTRNYKELESMQFSVILYDKAGLSAMTYGPFAKRSEAKDLADHIRKVFAGQRRVEVCLHSALRNPNEIK